MESDKKKKKIKRNNLFDMKYLKLLHNLENKLGVCNWRFAPGGECGRLRKSSASETIHKEEENGDMDVLVEFIPVFSTL